MRKSFATICLSLMMFAGCTCWSDPRTGDSSPQPAEEPNLERFVGQPAGLALDHFKVGYDDLETHHERPLTLSAVSFEVKEEDHTKRIFLWLDSETAPRRRGYWDFETIRNAKVTKIASEQIDIEKSLMGQPAAVALDHYKVGFDDLAMEDEPPGKLRAVSFSVKKRDHTERVFLLLDYNLTLFSMDLDWDFEAIRKAKVIKITAELCFD